MTNSNAFPGKNATDRPLQSASASSSLRSMLKDPSKIIVAPGVYDGFTARMALAAGFECLYMTGAGTSMSRLGMADLGLATMNDMKENAEMIASLERSVPLIADADTGYGSAINVGRTVEQYIRAGVAAFHLEDQVVNKRCGHLEGKQLVSKEEFLTRIRAAVNMRRALNSDVVIIARTDALHSLGFDEAVDRLQAAVKAGADVAFLEAIETKAQAVRVCEIFRKTATPVMYGMVQGSKCPQISVQEAKQMGIKVIVFAAACLLPSYLAVTQALKTLKQDGDVQKYEVQATPRELFEVCGLNELMEFDRRAGSETEEDGYGERL
jgi:2-methylisocitrate lyase-like PEP mutase family enzyme